MEAEEVSTSFANFSPALPPDCLELLRIPQSLASRAPTLSRVLLCGSYCLDATSGIKTGALELLQLAKPAPSAAPVPLLSLTGVGGAVFDARWLGGAVEAERSDDGQDTAGGIEAIAHVLAATAAGYVEAHVVALRGDNGGSLSARQGQSSRLSLDATGSVPPSALAMCALDDGGMSLAVSRSDGCISLVEVSVPVDGSGGDLPAAAMTLSRTWHAHTDAAGGGAEVWAVAAPPGPGSAAVLWSGADDALLKVWDTRAAAGGRPAAVCRAHRAGVCSIAFHPTQAHLVATGSYDEELRLWDARQLRAPLTTVRTGGGVWKLKWRGGASGDILAACMYGGAAVFHAEWTVGEDSGLIAPSLRRQRAHAGHGDGALVYGAEWLPSLAARGGDAAATCAFYTRSLQVWGNDEA